MIKHLTVHGNSLALVIEKGILELLGIGRKTPLEISTDGSRLIISPPQKSHRTVTLSGLASDESFAFTPEQWQVFLAKTQKEPVTRIKGKEAAIKHLDRLSKK